MILTVNGADFSKAYIGETNGYSVLVSGRGSSNTNWVDKGNDLTMSITINANYTYESLEITVGNNPLNSGFTATHSNGTVSLVIPANLITGVVRIKVNATSTNTGGGATPPVKPDPEPEQPGGGSGDSGTTGNGQWLSVLVTGDKNAHTEFMNYTETISGLTNVPCAYVESKIQKHLSGKRVTKVACYVLGSDSSISFYTNDYVSQSGTTSGDGNWQKVFTLTDPSSKVAAGTKTKKEYDVNFTIEEGDTLAFYDMVKMNSPKNDKNINVSYFLPVSYTMNVGGKFGAALPNFIAFDFYVE